MPCQPPPPFCHSGPFALLPGKSHEASPRDHGPCLSPALTPATPVTSWFSKLPWVLCTPRSLLFLPPGVLSFRTSLGLAFHPSCLCAPVLSWQGSFLTPSSLSVTQSCWEGLRRGSQGSVLSSSVPHTGLCVCVCVCMCVWSSPPTEGRNLACLVFCWGLSAQRCHTPIGTSAQLW